MRQPIRFFRIGNIFKPAEHVDYTVLVPTTYADNYGDDVTSVDDSYIDIFHPIIGG